MRKNTVFRKILLPLLTALLVLSLSACAPHALTPGDLALTEVGHVGGSPVLYEELYFLATSYYTEGMSEEELKEAVYKNIVTNHAILLLCEEYNVEIDEDELDDIVQKEVEEIADYLGGVSAYKDFLKLNGSTDHHVRFTSRCNALYDKLPTALALAGELLTDIDEVSAYIVENFVRTRHFMIANNEGDDPEENLAIAEQALADIEAGRTTVYDLIGGKYNEDLLIPGDGYTFGLGSMEQAYEDAAFSLEVGETSGIVTAMGELANGEYVECYYIIERLDLTEEFVKDNYEQLEVQYSGTVAAKLLEDKVASLSFTPNEYCASLTLTSLEPVTPGTDVFLIVTISVSIASAVIIALAIFLIVRKLRSNSAARLATKRAALQNANNKKGSK